MDFTTTYMGLKLTSPLVASASPLWDSLDNIKRAEDAGAGAVVLFSLFEEQIRHEREMVNYYLTHGSESFPEAVTIFPEPPTYHAGPDQYLELIQRARAAVDIPVVASLNGTSIGSWTKFARRMQEAGASALELNVYDIPTDMDIAGTDIEQKYIDILSAVKTSVSIPVAVKLSPYFSNMANMARRLDQAGADALVIFNRFYQPDINLETLEVEPHVLLSTPQSLRLPLRWIAILYGRIHADIAATSGVHTPEDALKVLMAGANVAMMTSALLKNGIDYLKVVKDGMVEWLETNEYDSVSQMRGSLSQINSPDPGAFERVQYMRALTTYRVH
ncbi:MAG: dihydroorotate dehydrogenase-like protein [Anaerolineae bacterium]|nr:dihydroorotate dehydrogenase-like protein [Anaerolineae bacterium]